MALEKVCPICNRAFKAARKNVLTCGHPDCIRGLITQKMTAKFGVEKPLHERDSQAVIYSRTCHDCGRPENNYRCPACLRKWRAKYNVTSGEEGYE